MKIPTIFLGGTCNGSKWRSLLIPLLTVNFFNPEKGVGEWKEEDYEIELKARAEADFVIYAITPKMTGFYSIAEAVEDSNKRPEKTVFLYLLDDEGEKFDEHQIKSLKKTAALIKANGGLVAESLKEVAEKLNAN